MSLSQAVKQKCISTRSLYPQNLRTLADPKKAITNLAGYPKDKRISTYSWRRMVLKDNANISVCMWNSLCTQAVYRQVTPRAIAQTFSSTNCRQWKAEPLCEFS